MTARQTIALRMRIQVTTNSGQLWAAVAAANRPDRNFGPLAVRRVRRPLFLYASFPGVGVAVRPRPRAF